MHNPDPYGVQAWEERESMYQQESSKEDMLYEQLLCAVQALPESANHASTTSNKDQWLALNTTMDEMVQIGHPEYAKFKIETTTNGNGYTAVNITALRMKMMQALGRMGNEFGSGSPAYDLSQFKQGNGQAVSLSHFGNSTNSGNAHSEQSQQQRQEMTMKLEQHFDQVEKQLTDTLSDAQKAELMPLFSEWKAEPTVWSKAEKVAGKLLGFGRDSFLIVLPLLAQAFLKANGMG